MPAVAPFGSWQSPITPELVASEGGVGFGYVDIGAEGAYWTESRPHEQGRTALVFRPYDGEPVDVVPAGFNVRTRVHEYGGGAWFRDGKVIFCSSFDDSRLYRLDGVGATPQPITPESVEPHALRYADGRVFAGGRLIVCVRETHGAEEPKNELVVLPSDGSAEPRVVATGRDFYAAPRPSPDGACLAWLAWDHPHMPFEGTDLCVAPLAADGSVSGGRRVAGSEHESIFQPDWSADGLLHFVSDRTGWSNLYVERDGKVEALTNEEADLGYPQWVFDLSRYAFLDDGRIACVFTRAAVDGLELLDPQTGELTALDLPYSSYSSPSICCHGGKLIFPASAPSELPAVVEVDVRIERPADTAALERAEAGRALPVLCASPSLSQAPTASRPTASTTRPTNPEYAGPDGELPPLVVLVHGGPTAHVTTALDLHVQVFTSRGIAVVDLNYGGSTGYGRDYRDRLRHGAGAKSTSRTAPRRRAISASAETSIPTRVQITGGSAGGYTTLMALAVRDEFASGASYFGVADLVTFHGETHKFESHYDDYLVGPWPEKRGALSRTLPRDARGLDLRSAAAVAGPRRQGRAAVPVRGDRRRARSARHPVRVHPLRRRRARVPSSREHQARAAAHLSFLAQVSGFELADEIEPVEIENLRTVRP